MRNLPSRACAPAVVGVAAVVDRQVAPEVDLEPVNGGDWVAVVRGTINLLGSDSDLFIQSNTYTYWEGEATVKGNITLLGGVAVDGTNLGGSNAQGTSLLPVGATAPRLVVPAGGHYISVIDNDFPFTRNQKGLIRITGSQPALLGFGLIFDLNSGFFFTSPAFGN